MGGFFGKSQGVQYTTPIKKATEEKKETRTAKGRLLATEGENKGEELQAQQGRSVRKVFGA